MNEMSPMIALVYCFGRVFQASGQEEGTETENGRLLGLESLRQSCEPRETKIIKISGQNNEEERTPKMRRDLALSIKLSTSHHVCVRLPESGERIIQNE